MRLPRASDAVVDAQKVRDYLLSPSHRFGRHKARFFNRLGYVRSHWQLLRDDLVELAKQEDATPGRPNAYGSTYKQHATLTGPSGRSARIITVWIVLLGEKIPRFVTAFPGDER